MEPVVQLLLACALLMAVAFGAIDCAVDIVIVFDFIDDHCILFAGASKLNLYQGKIRIYQS